MVCLRNISVHTLHKGDTNDDDNILNPNDTSALFFLFTKYMLYKTLTKLLVCQKPLKLGLHAEHFIFVEGPVTAMTKYRVTASGKNKRINLLVRR
jgi:hypothetical protein